MKLHLCFLCAYSTYLCYQAHLVSGHTVPSPWDVLFNYLSLQLSTGPPPRSLFRAIQALAGSASALYQTALSPGCPPCQRASTAQVRALCFHSIPCSPIQVLLLPPCAGHRGQRYSSGVPAIKESHVLTKAGPPQKPPTPTGQTRRKHLTPSRAQKKDRRPPGERGIQVGPQRTEWWRNRKGMSQRGKKEGRLRAVSSKAGLSPREEGPG